MNGGFWDRLATRVRPTDTLKTIENPRVIARAFSAAMWAGAIQLPRLNRLRRSPLSSVPQAVSTAPQGSPQGGVDPGRTLVNGGSDEMATIVGLGGCIAGMCRPLGPHERGHQRGVGRSAGPDLRTT